MRNTFLGDDGASLNLHQPLIDYFLRYVKLSQSDIPAIVDAYSFQQLGRKQYFFEAGSPCKTEGFVLNGSLRVFYNDPKGTEHVLNFTFSDWWVSDIASFYDGNPARLSAQAMEDSTLLVTTPEKKENLLKTVPSLERVFRIITQKQLAVLQKRFLLTISENAVERYKELLERAPGIEQLVPQHQIASYLGILPESLSRMKKNTRQS
jgi:CRP-like cAMP-binding protein